MNANITKVMGQSHGYLGDVEVIVSWTNRNAGRPDYDPMINIMKVVNAKTGLELEIDLGQRIALENSVAERLHYESLH